MIIKVYNPNREGYFVKSEVAQFHYNAEVVKCENHCTASVGEGCDQCPAPLSADHSLLKGGDIPGSLSKTEPLDAWYIHTIDHKGNEYNFYAEIGNVYIMNDDGKTIDRF